MPLAEVMSSPRYVDISITSKCNLRCKYCYFFDRPGINYIDWFQFMGAEFTRTRQIIASATLAIRAWHEHAA